MFKFKPYGPFEVPSDDGLVPTDRLRAFWEGIEERHPGLQDAIGCYIFGMRAGKGSLPCYVGKTERASFKREAFQPQKLLLYQKALKGRRKGTPLLYLIALLTPTGKHRGAAKGRRGVGSIRKLEEMLIGTCLSRNSKLVNKSATKYLLLTQVPGYFNEPQGARSHQAKELALLLGGKSKDRTSNAPIEE